MPKLQLIDIECETTEDTTGADEAYLEVNGRTVWKGSLNDGQAKPLSSVDPDDIRFTSFVKLTLFDEDTGFFDEDDNLGTVSIRSSAVGTGEQVARFTGDGAEYRITYEVLADDESEGVRAQNRPTHQVRLKSLYCLRTEDVSDDEPYIRVGDRHVWGPKPMGEGDMTMLDVTVPFRGSLSVELKEADTGFFDADDYLGRIDVTGDDVDRGELSELFLGDGAIYVLLYDVDQYQGAPTTVRLQPMTLDDGQFRLLG